MVPRKKSQKLVLKEWVQTSNLYREESVCAPIGISLWKMSGPETEESNGWNGIGFTRGAAVKKKKIRSDTSLLMYSGRKRSHLVVRDK